MSLHPKKKSDMGKEWMQKRLDRSKKIHPEYHLIITEGTKTEPEYFNTIKEKINQNYSERIHLEKGACLRYFLRLYYDGQGCHPLRRGGNQR